MKKIIALLLVLVLAVSCIVGCAPAAPVDTKDTTPADTKATTPKDTEPVEVEDRFDGTHEIVEVTLATRTDPQTDDWQVITQMNKLLEERYNLHLNLIAVPSAEYNDRMTLMMTSGEEWDLCFTSPNMNKYSDRVAMGAFYDLNELMDSPVWEELMEVYPEGIYDNAIVDGHLYALPNYQILYSPNALFIQKDLADKYGLSYKTGDTVKDVRDPEIWKFLESVRDNEEDIWPLRKGGSWMGYIINDAKYTTFSSVAGVSYSDPNFEVVRYMDDPAFLEYYKDMNMLFREGMFREDALLVNDDTSDFKLNRYAIHCGTGKPGGDVDTSNQMGEEYIMVYLDNGEIYRAVGGGMATMTAINYASKDPEAALKFLTVMWKDKEIYNMFLYGLEGEHHIKVGENRVELIPDSGYNRSGFGWGIGSQFNAWLLPGQADDVWEQTDAMNRSAKPVNLAGFVYSQANVETEVANIKTAQAEYGNLWLTCETDAELDEWYKKYRNAVEAGGVQAIIDDVEEQIAAWRKANGK